MQLRGSATLKDNATWPWIYKRIAGFMEFGHASLLNGGVCKRMMPACPTGCKGQNMGDQVFIHIKDDFRLISVENP